MPVEPFLSIVIPAYNEEQRLPDTLTRLRTYCAQQPFEIEVLVVDDGSQDGTCRVVEERMAIWPWLRLLPIPHGGKGQAIKQGFLAAQGGLIFMCDADLSMPVEELGSFLAAMQEGCDVAIGSREAPGAVRYGEPVRPHLMGRVFNWLVRLLALPKLKDTQCGFKCFKRQVAYDVVSCQQLSGWGFDVELLFIARKRGYVLREVPIAWYYKPSSRVHPLRDALHMTRDLFTIRRNEQSGCYERVAQPEGALTPGMQRRD